ncbi:helix-turn-helix domain-containing protein [Kutzneria buriramensis]|uniref:nSTAND1 domain-containing NTPase n=1 Tax=Kutzneria buriramensis TaxID=1045776 RepID=UPI00147778B5|nr:helix-turn-helix domain-containing protein [Kutzneria buriramensis]
MQSFAARLRKLREQAGSPGYRELARRAHYSATTLSDAAGGRKLPSLAVTLAYVAACDGDRAEWEAYWRAAAAELAPAEVTDINGEVRAPYVGLASFQPEDADRFFGREHLVGQLTARLRRQRFIAVFGPSGSGKSSLLRAGLIPAVTAGHGADGHPCSTVLFTPGEHPLQECATQFAARLRIPAGTVLADLETDPTHLHLAVRQVLADKPDQAEMLLVVDQFEELFTVCRDTRQRSQFIAALLAAAQATASRARVVLGIRADFYAHCAQHPDLVEALEDAQVLVGSMRADELRAAITRPAAQAGLVVEAALVSTIVSEMLGNAGALPLMSHALVETWRRRRGTTLSLTGYQEAGGVAGALSRTAEHTYQSLSLAQQRTARAVLLRLVSLNEGAQDTRRRCPRAELDHLLSEDRTAAAEAVDETVAVTLEALAQARLLTVDADSVQIAHEALIRSWPRLRQWLDENRDGLRTHRQLTEAAQSWDALDRDPGSLYRGARLAAAQAWVSAAGHAAGLNAVEREFLGASDRAARHVVRRQRRVITALVTALVVTLAAAGVAIYQRQSAVDESRTALAGKLALQSTAAAPERPDEAMLLAVGAYYEDPTAPEARDALLSSQSRYFIGRLTGHTNVITGLAFSPDNRVVATASFDNTVRLWDPHSRTVIGTVPGRFMALSPDGRTIATDNQHATVTLWDVAHQRAMATFTGDTGGTLVDSLTFSPDGQTLATTSNDRVVRLWDMRSRSLVGTLQNDNHSLYGVAFSPDGHTIATTTGDGSVRLWDVASRTQVAVLTGNAAITAVAFSPDGHTIATTTGDGSLRLWDVASGKQFGVLTGTAGPALDVVFSPDGRTVAATSGADHTVMLWALQGPIITASPAAPVTQVTFSRDGRFLATAQQDGVVRLWDALSHAPQATLAGTTVAFSPGDHLVATGGDDGIVRLWDTATHTQVAELIGHVGPIRSVAFSPDGRVLSSAGDDATVRLWDVAAHRQIVAAAEHTGPVTSVAFSSNGTTLASAGDDGFVRLWDVVSHKQVAALIGHSGHVHAVAFSPDGTTLASAGDDGFVRLWDVVSHKQVAALIGHSGHVHAVAFSPDGTTLASAGDDGFVRLWDVVSHKQVTALTGHTGPASSVAFSPDGHALVSGGEDTTARQWVLDPVRVVSDDCRLLGATARTLWEQLLAGLPYPPLCPGNP